MSAESMGPCLRRDDSVRDAIAAREHRVTQFTGHTIHQTRRALAARLAGAGIDTPDLDARLLVGAVLDLDLTGLSVQASRRLTEAEAERLDAFVQCRVAGEPVARIVGAKEFWGLPLRLSPATLVPRPDTETLIETALALFGNHPPQKFADLGTGSGAILLALLSEWPASFGLATDLSTDALQAARANARHLGLADRAAFVACDYASALRGAFDLIVSNPPYIRSADIANLATEVRDHDPALALDGGADGLVAYRMIVAQAVDLLAPSGTLIVEIGHDQADDVVRLMAAAGLVPENAIRHDLGGRPRVAVGHKTPPKSPNKP